MYIDVHCHVDMIDLETTLVVDRARKAGVGIIVSQGVDEKRNRNTLALAGKFPEIKAALGVYPLHVLEMSDKKLAEEMKFIRKNRVVAIGEVGLDFKESAEKPLSEKNKEKQKKALRDFVKLANEMDVPIIVHSRSAEKEAIDLLKEEKAGKVIMHCFSGKIRLVKEILQLGWSLSIPTSVKRLQHFQEIIRMAPIERLFCETDSPYLHPDREFPNEPANVVESYKKIAEVKGLPLKKVEKAIEKNYGRMFKG